MNNKLKQFVVFGITSVVALVICLGVLVVTVNNLYGNTGEAEIKNIINKTELDSTEDVLADYINTLILKTNERFVKTKTYTEVSVSGLKVLSPSEKRSNDEAIFNFAKDKILPAIDSYYEDDFEGTFEKDNSKKLDIAVDQTILNNASFSIGQVDENGESVFDDEGNLVDNEFYYLTYDVVGEKVLGSKNHSEMFSVKEDLFAKEMFIDTVKENCMIDAFEATPDSFTIKAKVNRENDEIQYINVIRSYSVTMDAKFVKDAEVFGDKEISFVYTVTDTYEYSYAGISFVEDEVAIGVDEEYMLNVNAVIDDDSVYTVEFTSSDENIASVDEMGYVKFLIDSQNPVTIAVKLNYLGETFTDTCVVTASEEGGVVNE